MTRFCETSFRISQNFAGLERRRHHQAEQHRLCAFFQDDIRVTPSLVLIWVLGTTGN